MTGIYGALHKATWIPLKAYKYTQMTILMFNVKYYFKIKASYTNIHIYNHEQIMALYMECRPHAFT